MLKIVNNKDEHVFTLQDNGKLEKGTNEKLEDKRKLISETVSINNNTNTQQKDSSN